MLFLHITLSKKTLLFSVVGTPFYLMDYVKGRIFSEPLPKNVAPEELSDIYKSFNKVLQKIHSVDVNKAGLQDYGKPGEINKFLKRFQEIYSLLEVFMSEASNNEALY